MLRTQALSRRVFCAGALEANSRDHEERLLEMRRRCWQEGAAPPLFLHRLHSTPPVSLRSGRHVLACRAGRSVLEPLVGEHRRIDPLAIVAHAQSELLVVLVDLDFDPRGMCVPKRVAKGLRRDLVDLVADDWVYIPRLALDRDVEVGSRLVSLTFAGARRRAF